MNKYDYLLEYSCFDFDSPEYYSLYNKPVVYFIVQEDRDRRPDHSLVKIGKSINLGNRLRELQVGNPHKLHVYYAIACEHKSDMDFLEKGLHELYAEFNYGGEWHLWHPDFDSLSGYEIYSSINKKYRKNKIKLDEQYDIFGNKIERKPATRCFFYTNQYAQILTKVKAAQTIKVPWRTMSYPTHGKQLLLPHSDKYDTVFISHKKHTQNMEQNRFEKNRNSNKSLFDKEDLINV